jgi:hypothetical protein
MLRIEKLRKVKGNFPVLVGSNIIPKNICKILIEEISNSKSFDDMIMGGRSRINKGSKNFDKYIKQSKISKKLFKLFNSKSFIRKLKIYSKKDLKIDLGKTQIFQRFLIQKNLLSKKN